MLSLGEVRTTAGIPGPPLSQVSQSRGTPEEKHSLVKQDVKQPTCKVKNCEHEQYVFTHGLHRLQHVSFDSPVRFMMYSEAAAAFISLHSDNTVWLSNPEGHKQSSSAYLPFMGLTATKMSDCFVGWGPGSVFTLLDRELRPLDVAHDALDIRVCEATEHSTELVTAGVGNVCVWSVMLMRCKVKIQQGLKKGTFTLMALAPPRSDRPNRAFVVSRWVVAVVDLDAGKVLEKRRDLHSGDITAVVYCSQLDCLITASLERSIKVWSPDWELHLAFEGQSGVVSSLFFCPVLSMLLSASDDGTICCWNVEEGNLVECINTEQRTALLCIGGDKKGDTFFTFSHRGVDFWSIRNLYTLHCKLKEDKRAPLRQIKVSPFPAPYPTRVLCISGDSDIMLVAAETGAVLTSFKAKQRILSADYCLHKEIVVAVTETGTVLQANTLTNPITLIQEWKSRGQGPWRGQNYVTEKDAKNLQIPGPACCLVLYSCVAEAERALEEWTSLQERRGCSHRNTAALDEPKNKFLIILGQSGGCVSVLKIGSGKVTYRTPAHSGQRVTSLQVYPENGYLLSTGEDMTVVVWKVSPHVQECLNHYLTVRCGQPQVNLAVLGPQLALTFQQPDSGINSLMHFNLLDQSETGPPTKEGHSDHFTGLCVCPDLEVYVSSSLDRTVLIWDEENHLISKLQLNAVPQSLAYGRLGGELYLGIKGNLYRLDCAKFLPHKYQQMLLYTYYDKPPPDLPITESTTWGSETKNESRGEDKEEVLPAITNNLLLTEDMLRWQDCESLETLNMDLAALLQDSVKCHKEKPRSTKETKKEAFDRYMKIIYRLPFEIKFDFEDNFYQEKPFYLEPCENKPYIPPAKTEDVLPEPKKKIVVKQKEKKVQTKCVTPKIPVKIKPQPVAVPKEPVILEKIKSPETIPPVEQPKPKTPSPPPPPHPRTPTPPPQREPSPEVPSFLRQFADADWFKNLYPDKKCIPSSLSPEDFSLQLLLCLSTCAAPSKIRIIAAVKALHSQGLLDTDKLYKDLIHLVPKFVRAHMSPLERGVLVEMLNLLVHLKSVSYDLVKQLLTLLAFKKLGLRDTLLRMLNAIGVNEAEQWLWPELENWDSELQDQSDVWKCLYARGDCWLELWTNKYIRHERYLRPKLKLSTSVVDVLNYFCAVQKDEYRKARCRAPARRKDTVLLPLYDCSSQPILRLGETYCMARKLREPGIILPPLRSRPFLTHFPNFISLPLPRVTLSPFHIYSEDDWVKSWARRYFVQQQSYIEYYR